MNKIIENKKIYAIIVSYNAAPVINQLYERLNKTLYDKIYFFDDCSTDGSADVAENYDWIVIKNNKNLGHGGNLKKAIKTAFDDGADYAVEIHADNQYSPNEIVKAKQFIEDGYDLIIGSRFQNKNPYKEDGMPFMRYITNLITSRITSIILGIKLTEFHTGCKIYGKNLINKVPYQNNSDNYLFSFEILLQCAFYKLKYGEISITSSYEGYKQSCNYFNGMIYLFGNIQTIFYFLLAKINVFKHKIFK